MKRESSKIGLLVISLSAACLLYSYSFAEEKLIIFHADSLAVPFSDLEKAFEKEYPQIEVIRELSGSRKAARKIRDLGRRCDIIASADYYVIEEILMPEHTEWYLMFNRQRMVIAFTQRSKYGNQIDENNWYKILAKKDVKFGHSDPNLDPSGYRTLMVWKLADMYYKDKEKIGGKSIFQALDENCPPANIRPTCAELLPLLESMGLDYLFTYDMAAKTHNLKYIHLPLPIDLSSLKHEDFYKKVKVAVSGKKMGEISYIPATPIVYSLTIPKHAPSRKIALLFIDFLFGPQGQKILKQNFCNPLYPPVANDIRKLPPDIKHLLDSLDQ